MNVAVPQAPALSISDAALLEATSDPLAYIERFLVPPHMDTEAPSLP